MPTRNLLFALWSDEQGFGFRVGHNKNYLENALNLLAKLEAPPNLRKESDWKFEDRAGTLQIGHMPCKPCDLFSKIYVEGKYGYLMVSINETSYYLDMEKHILGQMLSHFPLRLLLRNVKQQKFRYYLTDGRNQSVLDSTFAKQESIKYNFIEKDNDVMPKLRDAESMIKGTPEFDFYVDKLRSTSKRHQVLRLKQDQKIMNGKKEFTIVHYIVYRMIKAASTTKTPLQVWKELLDINMLENRRKDRSQEDQEHVKSFFRTALRLYVAQQDKIKKSVKKIGYCQQKDALDYLIIA